MIVKNRLIGIVFLAILAALLTCSPSDREPLRILISNDDGIEAPGIAALFETLLELGEVTVAAPHINRSGTSHGVTSRDPIAVKVSERDGMKWYAIDALPATCIRLALETLLPEKPDIVVSGINRGENIGTVTFYSATVAGAREAAFLGIPAMAVNLQARRNMDYSAAAGFIKALVKKTASEGLPDGMYLNVNIPAVPADEIQGIRITRQDTRAPLEFYKKTTNPEGETIYLPSYKTLDPAGEETDIWALNNGYISITPFTIDQTKEAGFPYLKPFIDLDWK